MTIGFSFVRSELASTKLLFNGGAGGVNPENMSYIVIPLDQLLIRPGLKLVKSEIGSCLIWKRLLVDLLLTRVCNNQDSTHCKGGSMNST